MLPSLAEERLRAPTSYKLNLETGAKVRSRRCCGR
jgi:hypothetical protein